MKRLAFYPDEEYGSIFMKERPAQHESIHILNLAISALSDGVVNLRLTGINLKFHLIVNPGILRMLTIGLVLIDDDYSNHGRMIETNIRAQRVSFNYDNWFY